MTLVALLTLLQASIPDACGQNRRVLLFACQDVAGEECRPLAGRYAASWYCLGLIGQACLDGVQLHCALQPMESNPRINTRSAKP